MDIYISIFVSCSTCVHMVPPSIKRNPKPQGSKMHMWGRELGKKRLAKRNNSLLNIGLEVTNFEGVNHTLRKRKILSNLNSDPSHMTTPG